MSVVDSRRRRLGRMCFLLSTGGVRRAPGNDAGRELATSDTTAAPWVRHDVRSEL
jgi:hypothetical protein